MIRGSRVLFTTNKRGTMDRELGSTDIAKLQGVSRTTAYRWLVELEKKYGPSVVGRRGKCGDLVTTRSAFEKSAPLAEGNNKLERRFKDLEERLADAETRADKQAETISELRRRVSDLQRAFLRPSR